MEKNRQYYKRMTNSDVAEFLADKYESEENMDFDEEFYENCIIEAVSNLMVENKNRSTTVYNSHQNTLGLYTW